MRGSSLRKMLWVLLHLSWLAQGLWVLLLSTQWWERRCVAARHGSFLHKHCVWDETPVCRNSVRHYCLMSLPFRFRRAQVRDKPFNIPAEDTLQQMPPSGEGRPAENSQGNQSGPQDTCQRPLPFGGSQLQATCLFNHSHSCLRDSPAPPPGALRCHCVLGAGGSSRQRGLRLVSRCTCSSLVAGVPRLGRGSSDTGMAEV